MMTLSTEHAAALEVRFDGTIDNGAIEGMAVRFGVIDTYRSTFVAGAFGALDGRSVPMLWAHDPGEVLGSWTSLRSTPEGLMAAGKLNLEVQRAREVRAMLLAGDIRGLSIGFVATQAETRNGIRTITAARLIEISLTAFPSVPGSGVTGIRTTDDRSGAAIRLAEVARSAARAFTRKG
jgi:HK97 family phage prohead protease